MKIFTVPLQILLDKSKLVERLKNKYKFKVAYKLTHFVLSHHMGST